MAESRMGYSSEGRLQDILALIQILGLGSAAALAPNGICRALQDLQPNENPTQERMDHWKRVASEHPEFFRVAGMGVSISLHHRFNNPGRGPLDPMVVHKLMETAINIHDRELRRRDRWAVTIPLIVAIIGFAGSALATIIGLISSRR